MLIKILGTGCPKCSKLFELVSEVVKELGVDANVKKITSLDENHVDVILTPRLVINDEVRYCGKVPSKSELTQIISSSVDD